MPKKKPDLRVYNLRRSARQQIKEAIDQAADRVRLSHEFTGVAVILTRADGSSVQITAGELTNSRNVAFHAARMGLERLLRSG